MSNSSKAGLPDDIIKVVTTFILMIPIGYFFRQFKNQKTRLNLSFILGNLIIICLYNISSLQIYSCIFINLLILKYCNKAHIGKIALIYNLVHNALINLYNIIFRYNISRMDDVSIPFMMLILKHISFAYSYQDSFFFQEEKENDIASKNKYYIYPENRVYIVNNFTIYEYLSYIVFYPTIVGGPFIEFNDFKKFIELREEYQNIPNTLFIAIKKFIFGFACIISFFAVNPWNKIENIIDYNNEYSFIQKCIFYVLGFFYVVRYFGGFSLIEVGAISCGFAYEKESYEILKAKAKEQEKSNLNKDSNSSSFNSTSESINSRILVENSERHIFKKAKVIDCINLLMIYDPDEFFRYWNISVHHFLKRNIYLRNISSPEEAKENPKLSKEKRNHASIKTFLLSAFWHGFYPSYFIVFFHFYLYTYIGLQIKMLNSNLKLSEKIPEYKNLLRFIIIFILIPYHCVFFVALDYKMLLDLVLTIKCFATVISFIILGVIISVNRKLNQKIKDK